MRKLVLIPAISMLVAFFAMPAWAHVTVNPDEAAKGGFATLAFNVPNEKDTAGTVKLEVALPTDHPIAFVSVKPHPGWTAQIQRQRLATPIRTEEGEVTEAVTQITWSGGVIKPGEFDEFEVSAGPLPENTDQLVFKALQTYDDGEVVRWIEQTPPGGQEPEHPAPVLKLVTSSSGHDQHAAVPSATDVGSVKRLAVIALVVAVLALAAAVSALLRKRPTA